MGLGFTAPAKGDPRGMRGGPAADHHGYSSQIKVELCASANCVAGRFERNDDIKLHFCRTNQEVISTVLKVRGKLKYEVRKAKFKLSLTEEGGKGKSKLVASNKCLQSKLLKLCDDERIAITDFGILGY